MKKLRIVVSLPNDNAYQHEQGAVAKAAAQTLGLELRVMHAKDDSITQSQQLLEIIQGPVDARPDGFLVEPVSGTGLPRVAEAATAAGIAWVISNSDVDYVRQLRKNPKIPVFMVTQGQHEIGKLQGRQLSVLLPRGGTVLYVAGPSMSSVATQRFEGMESSKPKNITLTTLRSKWSEESAFQSVCAWLRLATSRAEKFDLVAGQTHELALGARKALQGVDDTAQQANWNEKKFIGIGISRQLQPLIDGHIFCAAIITSVTMEIAIKMLVRALETSTQPAERSVVEATSLPPLDRIAAVR